jgi:DNA-binding response OmpR family regulator
MRLLVVEDNADCLEGVAECLRMEGAVVVTASSGNAGFATFLCERPDVILSDICMPDGDGYDFIRRIRTLATDHGGLTPAIAMSCASSRERALTAGFQLFVAKPFDVFTLIDRITELATRTPGPRIPRLEALG